MNSRLPLSLEQVGMTYEGSPPVTVLHDVNLTLDAGSFSLLLGPSGSGKTTLLGLIGGLEAPSRGIVRAPNRVRVSGFQAYRGSFSGGERGIGVDAARCVRSARTSREPGHA